MGNFEVCPYSTGDQRGPTARTVGWLKWQLWIEQNFLKGLSYLEDHDFGRTKVTGSGKNQNMGNSLKIYWLKYFCLCYTWRREWRPTPVFLPGEFHGQRSLEGYSPRDHKESGTTEATYTCKTLKKKNKEATSPMLSTSLSSFFPVCCYLDKNAKNLDFWNPTEFKSHYPSLSHDNVLPEVILSALCDIFPFCIWDCRGHLYLHGSKKKKACVKGLQSSQKIAASTNSNLISFS